MARGCRIDREACLGDVLEYITAAILFRGGRKLRAGIMKKGAVLLTTG